MHSQLHVHTEYSQFDSVTHIKDLLEYLKEIGVDQLAVTEHGVLTGVEKILSLAPNYNIKATPAVEAYLDLGLEGRSHLCLYAMDEIGFEALKTAVTKSYENEKNGFPLMTHETLTSCFGKDAKGHKHVLASSACVQGALSAILLSNNIMTKKIDKIEARYDLSNFEEMAKERETLLSEIDKIESDIKAAEKEIADLKDVASTSYAGEKRGLKAFEGEEKRKLEDELNYRISETKKAKIRVSGLKSDIVSWKKRKTTLNKKLSPIQKEYKRLEPHYAEVMAYKNEIADEDTLMKRVKLRIQEMEMIFGEGNFYIELQNHRLEDEGKVFPVLAKLAGELNLPMIATNDAHMVRGTEEEVQGRRLIKSLRYIGDNTMNMKLMPVDEPEKELYIKTDKELKSILLEILPEDVVDKAMAGSDELLSRCIEMPDNGVHYPVYQSEIEGEDSLACFKRHIREGLKKRFPEGASDEVKARVKKEFDVITSMGFVDYHLIVMDYVRYAKALGGIDFNNLPKDFEENKFDINYLMQHQKQGLGLGVGKGRGSAVGSIICYLLEITDINPLDYDLLFERFLNPERVSMPDIDSDIESSIREMVYDYIVYKYGDENVCRVGTYGTGKFKKSADYAGKLLSSRDFNITTGYDAEIKKVKAMVTVLTNGKEIIADRKEVELKYKNDKNLDKILEIFDNAVLINGCFVNYGKHAGGVVISDGKPVTSYIPLMRVKDKKLDKYVYCTQCDKDDIEGFYGLLKMDLLGLRTLSIINECVRMINQNHQIAIDFDDLPFEKEVFENIYCKALTNGVFQFESDGMKNVLKRAKPQNIEDIVILNAMYRPGPMDAIDDMIPVMTGKKKPEYDIKELKPILETTYGFIVYQEQVMRIFTDLAGYSLAGADNVRRAMSKKKTDVLKAERQAFLDGDKERGIEGCVKKGIDRNKADELFTKIEKFSEYAFNKSHAVAYSVLSYYTAYLKYHYPKEFSCACLNFLEDEKKDGIIRDGITMGVKFENPSVNLSDIKTKVIFGNVVIGLNNIKSLSLKSALHILDVKGEEGNYQSFEHFILSIKPARSDIIALTNSGAFDEFRISRKEIKSHINDLIAIISKTKEVDKKMTTSGISDKVYENASLKYDDIKKDLKSLINEMLRMAFQIDSQDLMAEKEYIGVALSKNPLDNVILEGTNIDALPDADSANDKDSTEDEAFVEITAILDDIRVIKTKNNKDMAFFWASDYTGRISICCFDREFSQYKSSINEFTPVVIKGKINMRNGEKSIIVKEIREPNKCHKKLLIIPPLDRDFNQSFIASVIHDLTVEQRNGYLCFVFTPNNSKITYTDLYVSEKILNYDKLTSLGYKTVLFN